MNVTPGIRRQSGWARAVARQAGIVVATSPLAAESLARRSLTKAAAIEQPGKGRSDKVTASTKENKTCALAAWIASL